MALVIRIGPIRFGDAADAVTGPPPAPCVMPHPSFAQTREAMTDLGRRLASEGPPFTAPHPSYARTLAAMTALRIRLFGS